MLIVVCFGSRDRGKNVRLYRVMGAVDRDTSDVKSGKYSALHARL